MIGSLVVNGLGVKTQSIDPVTLFAADALAGRIFKTFRVVVTSNESPALVSFDNGKTFPLFVPGGPKGYDLICDQHGDLRDAILLKRVGANDVTGIFSQLW